MTDIPDLTDVEVEKYQATADRIMGTPGNVKGVTFKVERDFVKERKGEAGVRFIDSVMAELDYPFSVEDMEPYEWYPEGYSVLFIYLSKELFGWSQEDIYEMGRSAPATSFIIKVTMKFVSVRQAVERAPEVWNKHFQFGELEPVELDEQEQRVVVRIRGYDFHPIMNDYYRGYFAKLTELLVGSTAHVEHRTCSQKDDDRSCDEYVIQW